MPALKRIMIGVELPGALKRSYPRINAGASTTQGTAPAFFRSMFKPIEFQAVTTRLKSRPDTESHSFFAV